MMQRAYARLHQAALAAGKQRRSRSVEHDVCAKQMKVCDAERTGFLTPIFILVTSRQRRVINYLHTNGQTSLITQPSASLPDSIRSIWLRL